MGDGYSGVMTRWPTFFKNLAQQKKRIHAIEKPLSVTIMLIIIRPPAWTDQCVYALIKKTKINMAGFTTSRV